ncbi:MAG TPA: hypothetical protein VLF43_00585 [Candidatus Saccharimonadales bacterium]|nr:hypothetical protein [Candidatus Saccharimonadales bacterium]
MQVKTTDTKQVWQSPDGEKTIWEVTLRGEDNKEYGLKTFSPTVATLGFNGNVETYVNQRGDRFVRQIVKQQPVVAGDSRDMSIRAQWAIGQAIALASATMDKRSITMNVIEEYAKDLFSSVSRVKGEELTEGMMARAEDYIRGRTTRQAQGV